MSIPMKWFRSGMCRPLRRTHRKETSAFGDAATPFRGRRYSYVDGEFRIDPRRLPLQYQVLKGYEYGIAGGELTASAARGGSFTIPISRWSAAADRGWYSG